MPTQKEEMEGDAGAAPACAVLRTAGYADRPIACEMVDRKGLAPLAEPMALRLKRPNRSLLREPIPRKWCSIGESRPGPLVGNEVFSC